MESRTQQFKNASSTNFLLRRTSSVQKAGSSSQVKLPRLREQVTAVASRTSKVNTSVSPAKISSPSKSTLASTLRSQALLVQEVPVDVAFSEAISARAWIVCRREPFCVLKCKSVHICRVQL